ASPSARNGKCSLQKRAGAAETRTTRGSGQTGRGAAGRLAKPAKQLEKSLMDRRNSRAEHLARGQASAALARLEEEIGRRPGRGNRHEQGSGRRSRQTERGAPQSMRNQTSDLLAKLHEAEATRNPQQQQQQQQQKKQQLQLGDQKSVQEISNALSKLRSEKTDLLAQCRKQQARIGHLESQLAECQTEREAADTAAEQLRYEAELEAQLDESQREADEYYKANIEAGRLAERLQQEVLGSCSGLRLVQLAASSSRQQRPGEVNFGAQELYIQQLQDEIAGLRDRMRAKQLYGDDEAEAGTSLNRDHLLKQVDTSLLQDQPLLSIRASPIGLESHSRRAVKDAVGDMTSKLAQLERMQYYLTREELAKGRIPSSSRVSEIIQQ
uniref:Centrosomal protein of 162 kDa n=1 Tax=Macrostomum lignano TaxID=282301 RepID=A0A1I8FKV0_9PLAT